MRKAAIVRLGKVWNLISCPRGPESRNGKPKMKTLDVQARLEYARAAVAVLRALQISNTKMRYGAFAIAIGIMSEGEKWEVWHKNQIEDILNLTAAAERQGLSPGSKALEFDRLVGADGKPGKGFKEKSRIVKK